MRIGPPADHHPHQHLHHGRSEAFCRRRDLLDRLRTEAAIWLSDYQVSPVPPPHSSASPDPISP